MYQGHGRVELMQCLHVSQGQMPILDVPASLGIFALTKDGSQKKVKDPGELAKMADTNTSEEGLDMRSHRKFRAST